MLSSTFSPLQYGANYLGVTPLSGPEPQSSVQADSFRLAVTAWRNAIGQEHVLIDEETRIDYAKTTLPEGTNPSGVLRPSSTQEVQAVVEIACKHGIQLHAISRGKNWGYGDACASTDGQVIVDLRRMNRIREVNVELGYAVIEPGVTQGQMYEYLCENDIPLLLDVTGAGPEASIVGNVLQRGFGHTVLGDRFSHSSNYEVVLRDGELIKTGFSGISNCRSAYVFRSGVGPFLDGLFTQSSIGIVTSICIKLMRRPEVIEGFALKLEDDRMLGEVVNRLRDLRMDRTIESTVHIANDLRVLSSQLRYPWGKCDGTRPLPEGIRQELRSRAGIGAWNLLGANYGTERRVQASREDIRSSLGSIATVRFFRRRTIDFARRFADLTQWLPQGKKLKRLTNSVSDAFDLLEGIPNGAYLQGVAWRSRRTGLSVDMRDYGLIWESRITPAKSNETERLLRSATQIFDKHGFEFLVTMTAITDTAMCCVMNVSFDKQSDEECERAIQCKTELAKSCDRLGYPPYRTSSVQF